MRQLFSTLPTFETKIAEAPRNDSAVAKVDKLVGAKSKAVSILLGIPETARSVIFTTVSTYGWSGPPV